MEIKSFRRIALAASLIFSVASVISASPAVLAADPGQRTVKVTIKDNAFTPRAITVPVGATVVWTNTGKEPHTVTADNGAFDSGHMQKGATFSYTFDAPGTFPYYCSAHGAPGGVGMSGTVTVVAGNDSGSALNNPPSPPQAPGSQMYGNYYMPQYDNDSMGNMDYNAIPGYGIPQPYGMQQYGMQQFGLGMMNPYGMQQFGRGMMSPYSYGGFGGLGNYCYPFNGYGSYFGNGIYSNSRMWY